MLGARGRGLGRALLCLAGACAGVSVAELACAQEARSAQLIWMREPGAQSCIDERELRARVERHLGAPVEDRGDGLVIEGRIAPRAARGYTAQLVIAGDASSKRELSVRGADCRALDDALVLVVAAAIETLAPHREPSREEAPAAAVEGRTYAPSTSSSALAASEPAQPPVPSVKPKPRALAPKLEPPPVAADSAVAEASEHEHDHEHNAGEPAAARVDPELALRLALGPRVSAGLMPAVAGGGALALLWPLSPAFRLELAASLWPAGTRPTDEGDAAFQAARLDALACPVWPIGEAVALYACAGPSFGALRARAELASSERIHTLRPLFGMLGWLFAELRLRRDSGWRVRAGAGASLELWRDRYAARDALGHEVLLHRVAPWVGLAGLELSAAL